MTDTAHSGSEVRDPAAARSQVEAVLNDVVRPLMAIDGGGVELLSIDSHRVVLRLTGSCRGCPGRPYTLASVIEPALRPLVGTTVAIHCELA